MDNRVGHIYAFIADGEDGFVSMTIANQHFPMVCTSRNEATLAAMREAAPMIARATGRTIRLVKFLPEDELEVFEPGPTQ